MCTIVLISRFAPLRNRTYLVIGLYALIFSCFHPSSLVCRPKILRWLVSDGSVRLMNPMWSGWWVIGDSDGRLHVGRRIFPSLRKASLVSIQLSPLGRFGRVGKLALRVFISFVRICVVVPLVTAFSGDLQVGRTGQKRPRRISSLSMAVATNAV